MFQYIAQVANFLTGNLFEEKSGNHDEDCNGETEISNKSIEFAESNKRSFNGIVTGYFDNRGLINDEIFFTQGVVMGNESPRVGDSVYVEATRLHASGGWMAKTVQITCLWDIDESEDIKKPEKDTFIGSVVSSSLHSADIECNGYKFVLSINKFRTDFIPFRGDYIQLELWRTNPENVNVFTSDDVVCVSPLREKTITGTVTIVLKWHGFIDDNIYFAHAVCKMKVKVGSIVVANVVESKQNRVEWRATNVYIKKHNDAKEDLQMAEMSLEILPANFQREISISELLDFGDIFVNKKHSLEVWLRNTGNLSKRFLSARKQKKVPGFNCLLACGGENDVNGNCLAENMMLESGAKKVIKIEFIPENLGKISVPLTFEFDGFEETRTIKANVIDTLQTVLQPRTVYKPATFFGKAVNNQMFIPGPRPMQRRKTVLPSKLGVYPIPSFLRSCLENPSGDIEHLIPELAQPLHISNYLKKLSSLLYIEEVQNENEMRQFDMEMVLLRRSGEFLSLVVPGLAEGRPSLLLGDRVLISYHGKDKDSPRFEGFVHQVHADHVLLKFSEDFHTCYRNDDIDVQFYTSRTSTRRCHQAIEHAVNLGADVLFPKSIIEKPPLVDIDEGSLKLVNNRLNERQVTAVKRILQGCGRPHPYVLFGPAGTGKTMTVVEAILQIFKYIKHARLLVCAPSNSAADLVAERLHLSGIIKTQNMIRINAFQRSSKTLPECIEKYCTNDTDDLNIASRHQIVVTTCSMAGFLYQFNLKSGHFTHVFVDEAGQATEPECMIPLGFTAGCQESQIVLAGDPYQLGPVLLSHTALDFGLGVSYLERLTNTSLYSRNEMEFSHFGSYNPLVVTKLLMNYRSHPALLAIPSNIFYSRELIPRADKYSITKFIGAPFLSNPNIPFLFHGVRGEDVREGNSPSWFNPMEAIEVLKYIQMVLSLREIQPEEIGVITPYKKQVEKIRVLLKRFDLDEIKVGSVEEFQGQERQCIIISTVRAKETLVDFDAKHNVGFLSNPKRFNVSITRAQSLLIVVGSPVVLCYDPYWCSLLQFAVTKDCYVGCDLPKLEGPLVQENFRRAIYLLGLNRDDEEAKSSTGIEVEDEENNDF